MTDTDKLVQEIDARLDRHKVLSIRAVVESPPIQALIEKANRAERLEEALTSAMSRLEYLDYQAVNAILLKGQYE